MPHTDTAFRSTDTIEGCNYDVMACLTSNRNAFRSTNTIEGCNYDMMAC